MAAIYMDSFQTFLNEVTFKIEINQEGVSILRVAFLSSMFTQLLSKKRQHCWGDFKNLQLTILKNETCWYLEYIAALITSTWKDGFLDLRPFRQIYRFIHWMVEFSGFITDWWITQIFVRTNTTPCHCYNFVLANLQTWSVKFMVLLYFSNKVFEW